MAKVSLRFFATFREAAGCAEAAAEVPDVATLLEELAARYGGAFSRLPRDRDMESFVVLVNGRNAGQLGGLGTELADGDEVSLFPPVSGG